MPKIETKIPKEMQWLFWSVDINDLDVGKDKNYIISQVLNYGTWEDLKWLFRVYSEKEIKNVVKNPGRGLWFRDVLNFWLLMFSEKLKKKDYQKAIFDLGKLTK